MVRNNICPNCRRETVEEVGETIMCSAPNSNLARCSAPETSFPISSSFCFGSGNYWCQNKYSSSASQLFVGTSCRCYFHSSNPNSCSTSSQNHHSSHHPVQSENLPSSNHSGWSHYSLLLRVTFILLLLLLPSTMSSPVPGSSGSGDHHRHHKDRNRIHERPAKWINPCRIPSSVPTASPGSEAELQTVPDKDIFHHIITQSTKAEKQAVEFMKDFYKEAFGEGSLKFDDIYYDWLKDIMEVVNADADGDSSSHLPVEETIKKVYRGLQKFAVGLEAIVLDQACYGGSFYQHFNEAEYQLKYVLCELQIAMLEKNIAYEDITRDIMAQEFRDMPDRATRNIRDWTIFRDYVKTLNFIQKEFKFFYNEAETSEMETNGA